MKNKYLSAAAAISLSVLAQSVPAAETYLTKKIGPLQPPSSTAACFYFQLQDVLSADPVVPGNPWFAIPSTHPGYREIFAMLLESKGRNVALTVTTTGSLAGGACGPYAGVQFVFMP